MEPLFTLNSQADLLDIKDGINDRLTKVRALFTILLSSREEKPLAWQAIYPVLLAADEFLQEIEVLFCEVDFAYRKPTI